MRVLLDTHVWLWMVAAPHLLSATTMRIVGDRSNTLLLSAASSWEIAIKHSIGRLVLPESPSTYVPRLMTTTAVMPLPIEHAHALAVATLPPHHRDPFDRLLIAQAAVERIPIVTGDAQFSRYGIEIIGA